MLLEHHFLTFKNNVIRKSFFELLSGAIKKNKGHRGSSIKTRLSISPIVPTNGSFGVMVKRGLKRCQNFLFVSCRAQTG